MTQAERTRESAAFSDFEIDLERFEVRRQGEVSPVEPQVFDLLAFLVRNPDRLITKDELIAKVWNGRIVSDATLASRLRAARRAIGDDGTQQKLIRTVHGRGIRFIGKPGAPDTGRNARELRQEIKFCLAPDGVRLAYATVGAGPPLVKPATWMTHLEYDLQSSIWRHWIEALAYDHTLVRYDQRANGLSDWDVSDFSLDAQVHDLEAVVDAAKLDRFPMVCISQGCAVGIAYAVRNPGRVTRMILYGGFARGWAKQGSKADIEMSTAMGALIEHGWGQDNPAFRQMFTGLFVPEGTAEHQRWFNDLQRASASSINAKRLYDAMGSMDVQHLLPRLDMPILVIHARRDDAVGFEEGRMLASEIPNARFVPLESRNHILLETEPAWQRMLEETRAFLAED